MPLPTLLTGKEPNQHDENRDRRGTGQSGKRESTGLDPWPSVVEFDALTDGRPKYKSAQIRLLWPEIKNAVAGGHKLRQIWECLDEDGIHLSYSKFRHYIARLKRMDVSGQGVPTLDVKEASRAVTAPESPEYDPAKNLRERLNKRPGFQFDERPPDLKKLV